MTMKIKAELMPLSGKYYDTKIKLTIDDDRANASSFWNIIHLNLHYETQLTYEVACALVEKINRE